MEIHTEMLHVLGESASAKAMACLKLVVQALKTFKNKRLRSGPDSLGPKQDLIEKSKVLALVFCHAKGIL